jgi:hypothetical protein
MADTIRRRDRAESNARVISNMKNKGIAISMRFALLEIRRVKNGASRVEFEMNIAVV